MASGSHSLNPTHLRQVQARRLTLLLPAQTPLTRSKLCGAQLSRTTSSAADRSRGQTGHSSPASGEAAEVSVSVRLSAFTQASPSPEAAGGVSAAASLLGRWRATKAGFCPQAPFMPEAAVDLPGQGTGVPRPLNGHYWQSRVYFTNHTAATRPGQSRTLQMAFLCGRQERRVTFK